jgi:L-2-hydroxyglutarate oxidase LhgO
MTGASVGDSDYDMAIVGAGIVGLAFARELLTRHPEARVVVVDKEPAVAAHQSSHNSGVIHGGIYYPPGSLKARLCVEGARLMEEFCDANDIRYERVGKLIVALEPEELPRLDELERRGHTNGTPGLRRLRADEIQDIEPEARGIAALHAPNTGIVDYALVARAIERELRAQGVEFLLGHEVRGVRRQGNATVLDLGVTEIRAGAATLCAGLWSDRLAVSAGAPKDPQILPFRGAYLHLAPQHSEVVRGLIYPVPDPTLPFLGVHVTKHIDGRVSLGPTAMLVPSRDGYNPLKIRGRDVGGTLAWPGTWRMAKTFWRTGVDELRLATSRRAFLKACARYVPALSGMEVERASFSGVRAQAVDRRGKLVDDFVISETPGAWHVRNAPSPAATSSFAIARYLADRVADLSHA